MNDPVARILPIAIAVGVAAGVMLGLWLIRQGYEPAESLGTGVCLGVAAGVLSGFGIAAFITPAMTDDQCPHCGYSTRGLHRRRCPECGGRLGPVR